MTAMDHAAGETLEQRCENYLEGRLSGDETSRFERELSRPDNMRVFGETLALRELLESLGPDEAPEGLTERIQADLGVAASLASEGGNPAGDPRRQNSALATVQTSLLGLSWMLRGPALAASAAVGSASGGRETLSGLQTARYALGPLNGLRLGRTSTSASRPAKPPTPKPRNRKSLWRRALRLVRR